jgi:drug/metabolite transporter (DMT)-like permease
MLWIFAALGGYFSLGLSQILDKFLLAENRIPQPAVYAFYVALFSAFGLVFSIFGVSVLPPLYLSIFIAAGIIFAYSFLAFYYAVRDYDVARVAPLQGLATTLTVIGFAFLLPEFFGEPTLSWQLIVALGLLVFGGFFIAADLPFTQRDHIPVSVFLSGFLLGVYFLLLKVGYQQTGFVTGVIWSRVGAFLGAFTFLLFPVFRKQILARKKPSPQKNKHNIKLMALFVFNKTTAGVGSFLIIYAISLGSTSLVQSFNGMQYVFILLLMIPFARAFPQSFPHHFTRQDWLQKIIALICIALGFYFLSQAGLILK